MHDCGKRKNYHEPKFLRNERRVIEERLQQIIGGRKQGDLRQRIDPQHRGGFQPQTRPSEQWTVDPFWEIDRRTSAQLNLQERPGASAAAPISQDQNTPIPMEEGEINSELDQEPAVLELPAVNLAGYVGVMKVQYVKMGHALNLSAQEENNWDLEKAVREIEKKTF